MSRRGLIIRLLIFVPLFAYFGYGAYQKWRVEREVEEAAPKSHKMQLPDGRSIDVIELTPEQAEKQYGIKMPPEPTASDASKPAPQGDGKSDAKGSELKIELPPPGPNPGGGAAPAPGAASTATPAPAAASTPTPAPAAASTATPAPAAASTPTPAPAAASPPAPAAAN